MGLVGRGPVGKTEDGSTGDQGLAAEKKSKGFLGSWRSAPAHS